MFDFLHKHFALAFATFLVLLAAVFGPLVLFVLLAIAQRGHLVGALALVGLVTVVPAMFYGAKKYLDGMVAAAERDFGKRSVALEARLSGKYGVPIERIEKHVFRVNGELRHGILTEDGETLLIGDRELQRA